MPTTRMLVILLAVPLLALGIYVERLNEERFALTRRAEVQARLTELRDRLDNLLSGDLQLVRGLVSVINLQPDIDQAAFERAVRPLLSGRTQLRNVAAAPDMVVRLMVPLAGNERALGLDYRVAPGQREAAERARDTGQVVLAGPLALVQGGSGLIARLPVSVPDPGRPGGLRFWGLVSAVIDVDRLFEASGLSAADRAIDVAIRGRDASGPRGEVFFGAAALFDDRPVLAEIGLPVGSWQIAATPRGGWPAHADNLWTVRGSVAAATLVVLGLFLLLERMLRTASRARVEAEAAQRQLDEVIEGAPDAMLVIDAQGQVVRANTQAVRLFGRSRAALEGQPLEALLEGGVLPVSPDPGVPGRPGSSRRRRPAAPLPQAGETALPTRSLPPHPGPAGPPGEQLRSQALAHRADGQAVPVEVTASTLHTARGVQVAAAIRDITDRLAAEAELQRHREHLEHQVAERTAQLAAAKDAAETANRAKSSFLANMSHEMRTPLHAITGLSYLIRRGPLDGVQAQHLDTLDLASRHLLEVINAVLDLSKIEAGRMDLANVPVDVRTLVARVVALLGERARAKGQVLQVTIDPDVPPDLWGDATRLQQALLNYADNAVKFGGAGLLHLCVRRQAEDEGRIGLRFEVHDHGDGIDEATLARLFVPFEQADNTPTRAHGGTGLGLAITRRLAQMMGGDAGADSRPGQGSCFWFTAWLDRAPAQDRPVFPDRPPPPTSSVPAVSSGGVLLVEDDPVNRAITQLMLEELTPTVRVAVDGQQAVELARSQRFDLILMDMQMPRLDGVQATRLIRAMPGHARTPIVAITASAFDADRAACIAAGMDDFIAKPVEPEVLKDLARRWLAGAADRQREA